MVTTVQGPADIMVQGHVVRVAADQFCAFPDEAVLEYIDFYDEYQARIEAGDPVIDVGEADEFGALSRLHDNPFTSTEEQDAFAFADDASTPWSLGLRIVTGQNYEFNGTIWQARQGHIARADWTPGTMSNLFVKVSGG